MPYEIKFEHTPVGISIDAIRGGGVGRLRPIEFVSEEDGDTLVTRLEGFGSNILGMLPITPSIQPNQVQHLLAIIRHDGSATIYLNELDMFGLVQVKRGFAKGDEVWTDDIADIHRLEFNGVTIPEDAGIVFIFSVGWRRAMFYDFIPLLPQGNKRREYDIGIALAQFFTYLMFQARFKITYETWQHLFEGQWFPFITLKESTVRQLIAQASNSWPLDELSEAIAGEVKQVLSTMLTRWKTTSAFADHITFLENAAERYLADDFLSTSALVYPRIEGILRSQQKLTDQGAQVTQKGLSGSAVKVAEDERHASSPLLPAKFREYLENVYFASFNPNEPKIKVSRNSIGHGVAAADECSLKAATISLLIVDQLCYCVSSARTSVSNTVTMPVPGTTATRSLSVI